MIHGFFEFTKTKKFELKKGVNFEFTKEKFELK